MPGERNPAQRAWDWANRPMYENPIRPGEEGGGVRGFASRLWRGFARDTVADTPREISPFGGGPINPIRGVAGAFRAGFGGVNWGRDRTDDLNRRSSDMAGVVPSRSPAAPPPAAAPVRPAAPVEAPRAPSAGLPAQPVAPSPYATPEEIAAWNEASSRMAGAPVGNNQGPPPQGMSDAQFRNYWGLGSGGTGGVGAAVGSSGMGAPPGTKPWYSSSGMVTGTRLRRT